MRAILIDPYARTVSMRTWSDVPSADDIYDAIGNGCDTFELHRVQLLSGRDALYCDENGDRYTQDEARYISVGTLGLVGRVLVFGHTADGELARRPATPLEWIRRNVRFI